MFRPTPTHRDGWRFAGFALGAVLSVMAAGCGHQAARPATGLTVQFTCDVHGRLEPCGCFTGQFGGLTRLKTALDAEPPGPVLRVDAGDAIGGPEDFDVIEYRYLLRAFQEMQFDALNVGRREAQLTATQLRDLRNSSPMPILSANLFDKKTGKLIFEPYRIVERGGYRIAILGVLDPRGLDADLGEGLEVGDMESALTAQLAVVRPQADLVVLLAFADEATLAQLARQFYEIQVILGGRVRQPAQQLEHENRSLIYFVTNEARALGILKLLLAEGAAPQVTGNEIRLLHDKIPQDGGLRTLAREYRAEVRRTHLAVDDPATLAADMIPGVKAAATFIGSANCITCHPSAGEAWTASTHAQAFAALKYREADADPKCIGCHTTGFGSASGYQRLARDSGLADVGCESCHGPGSLHARMRAGDTTVNFSYRPLGAGDCEKCHHGEFSRPFNWDEFWPLIKHGKEPLKTASTKSTRTAQ
jgi:hypothetical protein